MILRIIAAAMPALIVGCVTAVIVLNWLAGCGERFPTIDGHYETGTCLWEN